MLTHGHIHPHKNTKENTYIHTYIETYTMTTYPSFLLSFSLWYIWPVAFILQMHIFLAEIQTIWFNVASSVYLQKLIPISVIQLDIYLIYNKSYYAEYFFQNSHLLFLLSSIKHWCDKYMFWALPFMKTYPPSY